MSSRRSRRPPSLDLFMASLEPSPPRTANSSDLELDRLSEHSIERPPSVATSASSTRRMPSLSEVLSNNAPAPYTSSAFMAYLSHNHCLETLEFTMDASRYRKHYESLKGNGSFTDQESCEFVRSLWQRLLDAYITPNGPREVNLPCQIRDCLLSIPNYSTPPAPECLDDAVTKVYELMEESVLMPFIHHCQSAPYAQPWEASRSDDNIYLRGSLDERLLHRNRGSVSPPPPSEFLSHSYTAPASSSRKHHPFSVNLGWGRHSTLDAHSSWMIGSPDSMVEDTPDFASPRARTPMTPPSTPPTPDHFRSNSPKLMQRSVDKAWKKMAGKVWRKRGTSSNPDAMDYQ